MTCWWSKQHFLTFQKSFKESYSLLSERFPSSLIKLRFALTVCMELVWKCERWSNVQLEINFIETSVFAHECVPLQLWEIHDEWLNESFNLIQTLCRVLDMYTHMYRRKHILLQHILWLHGASPSFLSFFRPLRLAFVSRSLSFESSFTHTHHR